MTDKRIILALASALVGAFVALARLTLIQSAIVGIVAGVMTHYIHLYFITKK